MKIITVIGARPQFVKTAPLSRKLREFHTEKIIHTGQHYDYVMSDIFFKELDIPLPDFNLSIGSGTHGKQTGEMLMGIEEILISEKPDLVIVPGDTNSTLAGALAAVKMGIKVLHIEAGLRSFNRNMPEEINRIITDSISSYLFVPSKIAEEQLFKEGITNNVYNVGDIMYDAILLFKERSYSTSTILEKLNLKEKKFLILTIHRAENTEFIERMQSIFDALSNFEETIIFPIHPRTKNKFSSYGINPSKNIKFIDPVGYIDMIRLMSAARIILTDSGGMQKEAYYLDVPCLTLRDETEWVETAEHGYNKIVGADKKEILTGYKSINPEIFSNKIQLYGNGNSSDEILKIINSLN